ncbi:MAG: SIS domain-containing protein [Candidatus Marinimicrobia bacterium]|nr:SIS domain-containing protein [Candidatus Neomarinimicrobiota bacterium]
MINFFKDYFQNLCRELDGVDSNVLISIAELICEAKRKGKKVFLIGNGGSAATPSHSAGDWCKELGVRTLCLTDNSTLVTAWANDTSYDNIFVAQLETYLDEGDVVIAYSGSGNSANVLRAIEFAKSRGCVTVGMTGNYNGMEGGKLAEIADIVVIVPSESMERIEDSHLIINHAIKEYIKEKLM